MRSSFWATPSSRSTSCWTNICTRASDVFGGLGLIGGACYNLVAWFRQPGKIPTDGPEAYYHELPDKTKR
jgi:hypothetical protein